LWEDLQALTKKLNKELVAMKKLLSAFAVFASLMSTSVLAQSTSSAAIPNILAPAVKSSAVTSVSMININTADATSLTKLQGIGSKKAEAIVAWRKTNGNFKNIDQLLEVKGIGAKILEANRKMIQI
jgi:competence protein ComEA